MDFLGYYNLKSVTDLFAYTVLHLLMISYSIPKTQLEFSVDPVFIGNQDIMLDDITLTDCAEGDIPAGSDQLSCDFEKDACSWYNDQSADLKWKRENGQNPSFGYEGPTHDHTTGSGRYTYNNLYFHRL